MSAAQRSKTPLYIIRYSRRFFGRLALPPAVKNPLNCRKAAGADFGGLFGALRCRKRQMPRKTAEKDGKRCSNAVDA